jgi:serine protease
VSGTIPVAAGNAADSDVNDPASPFASNDTIASAQEISNPVTLGGYANAPGAGPAGRSQVSGDALDYFRVSLADGQVVRLFASEDLLSGDLDLALLTELGAPVAVSDTTSQTEEIVVVGTGTFLVEVSADSGFSSYVLTIGQMAAGAGAVVSGDDFVAGEVIVEFDDGSTGGMASLAADARARSVGMTHLRGSRGRAQLLGCKDEAIRQQTIASLGLAHLIPGRPEDLALYAHARSKRETRRIAKALRRQPGVRNTSLNYIRQATAVPADEYYGLQWHYDQINLPTAWDNLIASPSRAAQPVLVAVVDTGSTFHPDLQGQMVTGYDFIQDPLVSADGDGCDADATDPGDGLFANQSSFHGTHVIGTLVSRTSLQAGGDANGVAGVAFDTRVMPLRVLGKGGGTDFDIMQAVLYAAGLPNDCGVLPARPASVINMSLGGPGDNPVFQSVLDSVRQAGLVVVAAAGNEGHSAPSYPAAHDGVISVSAVDFNKELAPYSNHGPTIDLAAPGGDLGADVNGDAFADGVLSTWFDEDDGEFKYSFLQGTSMASPHVAGVIAMMLDVNDSLTPADIDALLAAGDLTQNLGDANHFGAGLIDAFKALSAAFAAIGGDPPANQPVLVVDPGSLNFGALATSIDVEARNAGGDANPLVVASVSVSTDDGGSWLSTSPASVDASKLGDWRISVNRNQTAGDGIYTGTVSFDSNENDIDIMVIMQVGGAGEEPADAGHHFVLLVNPDSLATVRLLEVDASGGEYRYDFSAVPAGDYLIVAGTDIDNDLSICDAGEACGGYPSRDNIEVVTISKNQRRLDFGTGFATSFESSAASASNFAQHFSRQMPRGVER